MTALVTHIPHTYFISALENVNRRDPASGKGFGKKRHGATSSLMVPYMKHRGLAMRPSVLIDSSMKRLSWQAALGISLVALSALLYFMEIAIFHSSRDTFFYLFQDIAFVPIQVLLVTLIINRLLTVREKRSRMEKLNMVIGAFFSEVGTRLLTYFSDCDPNLESVRKDLIVTNNWSREEFRKVKDLLKRYDYRVEIQKVDLTHLRTFFLEKKEFLLRLLENPNLLEHESFTELLLAVFHLVEELVVREDVTSLPDSDRHHIAGDITRAYILLVHQWLEYMGHLKKHYPYLFSLAIRINPFNEDASPIVRS